MCVCKYERVCMRKDKLVCVCMCVFMRFIQRLQSGCMMSRRAWWQDLLTSIDPLSQVFSMLPHVVSVEEVTDTVADVMPQIADPAGICKALTGSVQRERMGDED
eukprot:GHVU01013285.1.p2 GENE.GHVU01013285.1~~GHVU01013285.1.p2  ORF type:complete len:104 (+),score=6.44 GHVU01013285.1:682-993(+)